MGKDGLSNLDLACEEIIQSEKLRRQLAMDKMSKISEGLKKALQTDELDEITKDTIQQIINEQQQALASTTLEEQLIIANRLSPFGDIKDELLKQINEEEKKRALENYYNVNPVKNQQRISLNKEIENITLQLKQWRELEAELEATEKIKQENSEITKATTIEAHESTWATNTLHYFAQQNTTLASQVKTFLSHKHQGNTMVASSVNTETPDDWTDSNLMKQPESPPTKDESKKDRAPKRNKYLDKLAIKSTFNTISGSVTLKGNRYLLKGITVPSMLDVIGYSCTTPPAGLHQFEINPNSLPKK